MVWDSSQSALYNAVERHNENAAERPRRYAEPVGNSGGSFEQAALTGDFVASGGREADSPRENDTRSANCPRESDTRSADPPRESVSGGERTAECRPPCGKPSGHIVPRDPISAILSDKDMLLIAALILVLLHEKADLKLIAALAFILLG